MTGQGWYTLLLPKKTWGEPGSFTPPPKITKQQDLRNVCTDCVTQEGLCDQKNIREDDWWSTYSLNSFWNVLKLITWHRYHYLVFMLSYKRKKWAQNCRNYCSLWFTHDNMRNYSFMPVGKKDTVTTVQWKEEYFQVNMEINKLYLLLPVNCLIFLLLLGIFQEGNLWS